MEISAGHRRASETDRGRRFVWHKSLFRSFPQLLVGCKQRGETTKESPYAIQTVPALPKKIYDSLKSFTFSPKNRTYFLFPFRSRKRKKKRYEPGKKEKNVKLHTRNHATAVKRKMYFFLGFFDRGKEKKSKVGVTLFAHVTWNRRTHSRTKLFLAEKQRKIPL